MENAIRMNDTEVMRKQKVMFPTVSRRAFPDGKRLGSTRLTARFVTMRVIFDMGSNTASAMVVKRDSDPDEMAPYNCNPASNRFAAKDP